MSGNIEIIQEKKFPRLVAEEIVASIQDVLEDKEKCSLVLSGGSTPGKIYRSLSRPPFRDAVDWSRVVVFWGDERFVPKDSEHSNYRMAHETLLAPIEELGVKSYPINTELASAKIAASEYENTIRELGYYNQEDKPFDIVLLGLGTDGHTASIFPGQTKKIDAEKLCFSTQHPTDGTERISLSPKCIFSSHKIMFCVVGEEKSEILDQVLNDKSKTKDELPAIYFREALGKVSWFCDSLAASHLTKE